MGRWLMIMALVLAGVLASLVLYTQYFVVQVEDRFGPDGAFVNVDGARLHYTERLPDPSVSQWTGQTVVLIHGASANQRDMIMALANPLAIRGYRVIAFDRPGHGFSERGPADAYRPTVQARMIRQALDALSVEQPVIVGHSWGGAVAAAYVVEQNDALSGAVILAGATHPWGGDVSWYHDVTMTPVVGDIFRHTVLALAGPQLLPGGVQSNFAPNDPVADYASRAGIELLFRPATFRANSEDVFYLNGELEALAPRYETIDTPLIALSGDADTSVSYRIHSEPLVAAVPGADLVLLEGVGHMPHHIRTAEVVDAIARVMER